MSADITGTSWDQCRSMVQYSFTSTETRRLVRTDSPGRPLRLSHSSWTMCSTWHAYLHTYQLLYTLSQGVPELRVCVVKVDVAVPGSPSPIVRTPVWWWCRASCPRMSVDILGTNCDQYGSTVHCCFTSTETTAHYIRTESPGRLPRLSHSSWTLPYVLSFVVTLRPQKPQGLLVTDDDDDEVMLNVLRCPQLTY